MEVAPPVTYRAFWEAPRWVGYETFLRNQAFVLSLVIDIEVEKGWVRESGRFSVSGPQWAVDEFRHRLGLARREYERMPNEQ